MAVPTDKELRALLDNFVCVRLVQMYGVDLSRFQFDFSMTWVIFFANADGTLYGRYGTRSALQGGSSRNISVAGFKRSIEASLALHARYVADPAAGKREVLGKQTQHQPTWARAEIIPSLAKNKRLALPFTGLAEDRSGRAHGVGCIHCHMIPSNELMSLRRENKLIPERLVWPYPMPDAIGMHMDPRKRATVQRVLQDSAAAKSGILAGDEIMSIDGQTILSPADIQWVLHNVGEKAKLRIGASRDGEERELVLYLSKNWRRRLGDWRFINLGVCAQISGFNGRPTRGGGKRLAIRVQRTNRRRLEGVDLRKNDVIVEIDGQREPMNLGQLTDYLLNKRPGSVLEFVRRARRGEDGEKKLRVTLR